MTLPEARATRASERFSIIALALVAAGLAGWLMFGIVRNPPASWHERSIIGLILVSVAVVLAVIVSLHRKLPALDWTPRRATVTGSISYNDDPDADIDPYELFTVTLDIDGVEFAAPHRRHHPQGVGPRTTGKPGPQRTGIRPPPARFQDLVIWPAASTNRTVHGVTG